VVEIPTAVAVVVYVIYGLLLIMQCMSMTIPEVIPRVLLVREVKKMFIRGLIMALLTIPIGIHLDWSQAMWLIHLVWVIPVVIMIPVLWFATEAQ
jgi:hypothetical protein